MATEMMEGGIVNLPHSGVQWHNTTMCWLIGPPLSIPEIVRYHNTFLPRWPLCLGG